MSFVHSLAEDYKSGVIYTETEVSRAKIRMKPLTIPDELNAETTQTVQFFDYRSSRETTRQHIVLNQNIFSFLVEGTKEVFFDDSSLSINTSRFLLMKAGHCLMTEKLSPVRHYRSLLLCFPDEALLTVIRKANFTAPASFRRKSVYAFKYDAFIERFVNSLTDISNLPAPVKTKLLAVKLEEILLYLSAVHGTGFLYALLAHPNDTSQKFIQTVEANALSKLTLKELAFLCNKSVSTFKRDFEKQYAESPIKWFQNKRLEHAHYLLTQKQKNASEVYFDAGYQNLSSFIQAYKSKYGTTPKQQGKR